MHRTTIIIVSLAVVTLVVIGGVYVFVNHYTLITEPRVEKIGQYDMPFSPTGGDLMHFSDFDLLAMGQRDASVIEQIRGWWVNNVEGFDGIYGVPSYYFKALDDKGGILAEPKISLLPFGWVSFTVAGQQFTIVNTQKENGFYSISKPAFILGKGTVKDVRNQR